MTAVRAQPFVALRNSQGPVECFVSPPIKQRPSARIAHQPMYDGLSPDDVMMSDLATAYVAARRRRPVASWKLIGCAAFSLGFATCAMLVVITQGLYAIYQTAPQ